jgi:hypothetical protein
MQFKTGQTYSRKIISDSLGGSIHHYLPFKYGRVVCGCFEANARYNPDAPEKVTYGPGPIVEDSAKRVREQGNQGESIPVFLFRDKGEWEYKGRYRCIGHSRDRDKLKKEMGKNPERGPIVGILYFQRTSD